MSVVADRPAWAAPGGEPGLLTPAPRPPAGGSRRPGEGGAARDSKDTDRSSCGGGADGSSSYFCPFFTALGGGHLSAASRETAEAPEEGLVRGEESRGCRNVECRDTGGLGRPRRTGRREDPARAGNCATASPRSRVPDASRTDRRAGVLPRPR